MPYVVAINKAKNMYVKKNMRGGYPYLEAHIFETKKDAIPFAADPDMIRKVEVVTVKYCSDSGHGWYAVKRQILVDLGIADKVSAFSYQRGATVYLEEDRDASALFATLQQKQILCAVKVGKNYEGRAPIRSYDCFSA